MLFTLLVNFSPGIIGRRSKRRKGARDGGELSHFMAGSQNQTRWRGYTISCRLLSCLTLLNTLTSHLKNYDMQFITSCRYNTKEERSELKKKKEGKKSKFTDGLSQGLAYHGWGVKVMLSHPGFFEWLTNRMTDNTKPGSFFFLPPFVISFASSFLFLSFSSFF